MKSFFKQILKIFLIFFLAFIVLCIYAYYQMREPIRAFETIQKKVEEMNETSLQKEYGTSDRDKVFNDLIRQYLNHYLEGKDKNATK